MSLTEVFVCVYVISALIVIPGLAYVAKKLQDWQTSKERRMVAKEVTDIQLACAQEVSQMAKFSSLPINDKMKSLRKHWQHVKDAVMEIDALISSDCVYICRSDNLWYIIDNINDVSAILRKIYNISSRDMQLLQKNRKERRGT